MEFSLVKMSTKGQIVIPKKMRKTFKEGDAFLLVREKDTLVLRHTNSLSQEFLEDLKFSQGIERAWKEVESGKKVTISKSELASELEKW